VLFWREPLFFPRLAADDRDGMFTFGTVNISVEPRRNHHIPPPIQICACSAEPFVANLVPRFDKVCGMQQQSIEWLIQRKIHWMVVSSLRI
jgi:hypothetical protein